MSEPCNYVPYIDNPDIAGKLDGMYKQESYKRDSEHILSLVTKEGGKLLDAGCGPGRLAPIMGKRFEYVGVDASYHLIEHAKKNYPRMTFLKGDIRLLEFDDETFDVVTCINVIKHLDRPQVLNALSELVRVMKADGELLIRVPLIPETRSYDEYVRAISKHKVTWKDIAFHWSDIFAYAYLLNLIVVYPEEFHTAPLKEYSAPVTKLQKNITNGILKGVEG